MRISSYLAALPLLIIANMALAQQAPAEGDDMQLKCIAGRNELERIYPTLTDATKQGIVSRALDEIVEIEEDSDWKACLQLVASTLAAIK